MYTCTCMCRAVAYVHYVYFFRKTLQARRWMAKRYMAKTIIIWYECWRLRKGNLLWAWIQSWIKRSIKTWFTLSFFSWQQTDIHCSIHTTAFFLLTLPRCYILKPNWTPNSCVSPFQMFQRLSWVKPYVLFFFSDRKRTCERTSGIIEYSHTLGTLS